MDEYKHSEQAQRAAFGVYTEYKLLLLSLLIVTRLPDSVCVHVCACLCVCVYEHREGGVVCVCCILCV